MQRKATYPASPRSSRCCWPAAPADRAATTARPTRSRANRPRRRPRRQPGKYRTLPEPCGAVGAGQPGRAAARHQGDHGRGAARRRTRATPRRPTTRTARSAAVGRSSPRTPPSTCWSTSSVWSRTTTRSATTVRRSRSSRRRRRRRTCRRRRTSSRRTSECTESGTSSRVERERIPPDDSAPPVPSDSSGSVARAAASGSASSSDCSTPSDLQPRVLDDLGDEAFLDDTLSGSGSTAQQRTVTVAFRTSNVIVTIEYEEQPATVGVRPGQQGNAGQRPGNWPRSWPSRCHD